MLYTFESAEDLDSRVGVPAIGLAHDAARKEQRGMTYVVTRTPQGIVEARNHLARSALDAVRDCREQMRQGETAMWLNASYAHRHGASVAAIAATVGLSADTVRKELKRVDPRTFR